MIASAVSGRRPWSGLNRKRLQTLYVVAAAGLAALVPLMLFAGLWIRSELGKSSRDVESYLGARAGALSARLDAEIDGQVSALRALSALPGFGNGADGFRDAASRAVAAMPHWTSLTLLDAETGRALATTATEAGEPPPAATLARLRSEKRPIVEARGEPGEIARALDLLWPNVRDGAVASALLLRLDARDVQDLVPPQGKDGLFATVADGAGRIVAQSRGEPPGLRPLGAAYRTAAGARTAGLFADSDVKPPTTSAFVRSPVTGWNSLVTLGSAEADRLSSRSVWATIAAGAISLILAGILAVFIIHSVMERRVSDERLAASQALGDLDARLLATTQEALSEQRKASSEREVLLREIYHRVKNNLQIVQSLLRLGSRDLRPEQREPFESAVRRIGAMARVHTLLYNSPDLASIDFKDYLDELLKELSEGFAAEERSIESTLAADAMRMPLDTAVPLASIAVEILTNSFKHAFPHGRPGRISVDVHREDGHAVLRITDDGVGLAEPARGKRQLGLTIVRKLVQQIGGTLDEPPPGSSTFTVRFPLGETVASAPPLPTPAAPAPALAAS